PAGPAGRPPRTRARRGLAHQHVGSVRAAGPDAALAVARDLYTRRGDPLSLWVVRSDAVHAVSPDERDPYFAGTHGKPYRYPEHFPPLTEEGSEGDHDQ
ncbi:1,2-phenylacetyl-CoA epoxidase subunit B, partial [Streptomyces sp. NPDC001356]